MDSKEIIAEAMVDISITSSSNPSGKPGIKGTLITKGFTPRLHDKSYILKLNETVSWRVRITMQPISMSDFDPTLTRFDIFFEDAAWYSTATWFESL
jgi:hypothetical protein